MSCKGIALSLLLYVEDGMKIVALAGEFLHYFDTLGFFYIIDNALSLLAMFISVRPFSSNESGVNY
jgi:hypothetical protein